MDDNNLVIVFATAWNNFGISLPVLHFMLDKYPASVLYIKNPDKGMYCKGAPGLGGNIGEIVSNLEKFIDLNGYKKIMVLGFSSGGYAALYAAGAMGADSYVGFGVRTDWSRDCKIKISPTRVSPVSADYNNNALENLLINKNMAGIKKATLYYGDQDQSDAAHAHNMSTLDNFQITPIPKSKHNVVLHMIAKGAFEEALQTAFRH
jgi:hypothetical protein